MMMVDTDYLYAKALCSNKTKNPEFDSILVDCEGLGFIAAIEILKILENGYVFKKTGLKNIMCSGTGILLSVLKCIGYSINEIYDIVKKIDFDSIKNKKCCCSKASYNNVKILNYFLPFI